MKSNIILIALLTIPLLFTGCASILDGGDKSVQINSNPEGAKVTIYNKEGDKVDVQTTPAIVALKRSSDLFMGEDYKLVFEAPGYYPYETHVKSTIDPWYVGNIFFGGLIGILIVDPVTGDMFTLPSGVGCNLQSINMTPEQSKYMQIYSNLVQHVQSQDTK